MKKLNALKYAALIAALGLGTAAMADDQPTTQTTPTPSSDNTKSSPEYSSTQPMGQPSKAEKASSLVGMTVKNQQGETLGKIEDIVINLRSDRVAYAVLGQRETILSKQKLLAVPLKAFQPSADGDYLILNANKSNLAEAQGFNKDNWPSATSQHPWGAQPFWQGGSSQTDTTTPPSQSEENKNQNR